LWSAMMLREWPLLLLESVGPVVRWAMEMSGGSRWMVRRGLLTGRREG
jgi:hypothetical protein